MSKLVKKLKNNKTVCFDTGNFDDWCVYVVETTGVKKAPYDEEYFSDLQIISQQYKKGKVYEDFVKIYDLTSSVIDPKVLNLIEELAETYRDEHKPIIEQWFTVLYAGMIAEENKQYAILKKRIKRLGMYQTLVLNMSPKQAAKFSYGKKWRELDAIMKNYGF